MENDEWANYGHNVYNDYNDYAWIDGDLGRDGHYLLTGRKTTVMMNDVTVSYMVNPAYNMNVFVEATHRSFKAQGIDSQSDFIVSFGLRTSLDRKYYDF